MIRLQKAVSDKPGNGTLWVNAPGSAKNTLSIKWVGELSQDSSRFGRRLEFHEQMLVATTTLDELIAQFGLPDFIKIDVEGHELSVLRGLSQAVPMLSFEVNLPSFLEEGLLCVDRLVELSTGGSFNLCSDCAEGFAFEHWLDAQSLRTQLCACPLPSVEVFWRSRPN